MWWQREKTRTAGRAARSSAAVHDDVFGEDRERTAQQPHRAIGHPTSAAAFDLRRPPQQLALWGGVAGAHRQSIGCVRECGKAMHAGAALLGSLTREPTENLRRRSQTAISDGKHDE